MLAQILPAITARSAVRPSRRAILQDRLARTTLALAG